MEGRGLSVIIPTFNEERLLPDCLESLKRTVPEAEFIIADARSTDATRTIGQLGGAFIVLAPRGRATQMNGGAHIATGSVLWFVHADSIVPENAGTELAKAVADEGVIGGCFHLRFESDKRVYRISDDLGNRAVHMAGFALGDHGIFIRRDAFEKLGGFPEVPIMEDADLYRAAKQAGEMRQLEGEIITHPRRYEKHGPWWVTMVYFTVLTMYVLRLPRKWLHGFREWLAP